MTLTGDAKREYQRRWIAQRRQEWIDENGPCVDCGGSDRLEVDHADAKTKLMSPGTLWSKARTNPVRVIELAKCVVRCFSCHKIKTVENNEHPFGEKSGVSKLMETEVLEIREVYAFGGISLRDLAERYGVKKDAVHDIVRGRGWKQLAA